MQFLSVLDIEIKDLTNLSDYLCNWGIFIKLIEDLLLPVFPQFIQILKVTCISQKNIFCVPLDQWI